MEIYMLHDWTVKQLLKQILELYFVWTTESPFFVTPFISNYSYAEWYCENHNGRLLVMDTRSKYDHVLVIDELYHNGTLFSSQRYIGLSTSTSNCTNYVWSSGHPLSWSKWDVFDNEPKLCSTRKCGKLRNNLFKTANCQFERSSVCEYVTSESTSSTSSLPSTTTTSVSAEAADADLSTIIGSQALSLTTKTATTMARTQPMITTGRTQPITTTDKTQPITITTTDRTQPMTTTDRTQPMTTTDRTQPMTTTDRTQPMTTTDRIQPMTTTDRIQPMTTIIISTIDPTTINTSCGCCTRRQTNVTQLNQTELLYVIKQLKAELSVSKNNTSTHQRKLISVYESRPSSMVMGGVACTILSVVMGWIVVPDFITLCLVFFRCVRKNIVTPKV